MPVLPSPTTRRFRLFRAYWVTTRVLVSLGSLYLFGRLLGSEWLSRKLPGRYRTNALRLKETILRLKGLFIKVGQLVSIMTNFLPEDFRKELETLQDKIPPRPLEEMTSRIRQEFGQTQEALFASFDPNPIASASLAQVHEATLFDGRRVAVKIQYVDIEAIARQDLRAIERILRFVGLVTRVRGLDTNFSQVRAMILDELDFRMEARHIEDIAANFEGDPLVSFPRVVHDRSTARVLTTEYVEGAKVTDVATHAAQGHDRSVLAERILTAYCQMIFSDGLYHADPHPGNILVRPDGGIVFIDFGAVARLSPQMKEGIPQFLEGLLRRDTDKITRAIHHMGFIAYQERDYNVDRLIEYFYDRFLEEVTFDSWNLAEIQVDVQAKLEVLGDLRRLDISFRELTSSFQVPKDWVLLERTILLLMGVCTYLDPYMNPMRTIRPYLETFVLGKDREWKKLIGSAIKDMALSAVTLPEDLKRFLTKASRGEQEVKVRGMEESFGQLYALGHQLLYGLFSVSTGALSFTAYNYSEDSLALGLAIACAFFLLCTGGSMLKARRRRKKGNQ